MAARSVQETRYRGTGITCNAGLGGTLLETHCALDRAGTSLLEAAIQRLGLSARAYTRILRLARTVADMAESPHIRQEHLAEAIALRALDRTGDTAANQAPAASRPYPRRRG